MSNKHPEPIGDTFRLSEDRIVWEAIERGQSAEYVAANRLANRRVAEIRERMAILSGARTLSPLGSLPAHLLHVAGVERNPSRPERAHPGWAKYAKGEKQ